MAQVFSLPNHVNIQELSDGSTIIKALDLGFIMACPATHKLSKEGPSYRYLLDFFVRPHSSKRSSRKMWAQSFVHQRIAKGAGGKGPRQKTSKIVKKRQKVFRHFSTIFAQGKKRQKSSKSVKKFFDTFRQFSRGTFFPAPFAIR